MRLAARFWTIIVTIVTLAAPQAWAAETNVAVAANFTDAAKEIAAAFQAKTGHEAILSFGASGQLYTQITQDAPFQIFLSADDERPKQAVADGLGVPGSVFTYAIGKLVLWSKQPDLVTGEATLQAAKFNKLSICNPVAAPYGAAAVETMKALKLYDALAAQNRGRRQHHPGLPVRGNRQCRTRLRRAVAGGERQIGLALDGAAESLLADPAGCRAAQERRRQRGRHRLHGLPERARRPRAIIAKYGYEVGGEIAKWPHCPPRSGPRSGSRSNSRRPPPASCSWSARRSPGGWPARTRGGRRRSPPSSRCRSSCRPPCSASTCSSCSARTDPAAASRSLWGARTLAFTFPGLVIGSVVYSMPFVVQPIRNAFAAMGTRPLEVAATLRASPARAFWTVAVPLARPGFLTGAVLGFAHTVGEFGIVLMIGGSIPGRTKVLSVAIYDLRRDRAVARGQHPRRRHGRVRLFRHPGHDAAREAHRAPGRMSPAAALSRWPSPARSARSGSMSPSRVPGTRRHRAVRPVRLRQDHGAALHRRAAAPCQGAARVGGEIWQDGARFRPAHRRPSATCSRKPACSRTSRSAGTSCSAPRAIRAARHRRARLRRGRRPARPADHCSPARRTTSPAASASASRSAAPCCPQPRLLLMDEPLSALDRGYARRDPALSRAPARHARPADHLRQPRHDRDRAAGRPLGADGSRPRAGDRAARTRCRATRRCRSPRRATRRSASTASSAASTPATAS